MFKTTEEGLEIYKQEVEKYLKKCNEISTEERRGRLEAGCDYAGSLDWSKDDWEWKNNTEYQMHGMKIALGLSGEENKEIWQNIKEKLVVLSMST